MSTSSPRKSPTASRKSAAVPAKTKAKAAAKPSAAKRRNSNHFVVIMAGGRGARFWPVSREKTPKQLIKLLGNRSFLQQAVDRVRPLVPVANILIITNAAQAAEVRRQLPELPRENVVAEPVGRDTCAAVVLAAAVVGARSSDATMAVLPADHVIPEAKKFQQILGDALDLASRDHLIVTIGIQPTSPETGYGYIRHGQVEIPPPAGAGIYHTAMYRAEQFVEKPPLERAMEYLAAGNYRWNAGMFVWSYPTLIHSLEKYVPEMHAACQRWLAAAAKSPAALNKVLAREYPQIPRVSVDYALMEKAHNVVVADGSFAWDDLGAWPALSRHLKSDSEGNAVVGELRQVDSAGNLVYDARKAARTLVALVGVRDSIVVLTDDAVLIAAKSEAQKIKDLVSKISADPAMAHLA